MPTINQLIRKNRKKKRSKSKAPVLGTMPSKTGCLSSGAYDDAKETKLSVA